MRVSWLASLLHTPLSPARHMPAPCTRPYHPATTCQPPAHALITCHVADGRWVVHHGWPAHMHHRWGCVMHRCRGLVVHRGRSRIACGGKEKSLRRRTEGIILFLKQFHNACVGACAELPTMWRWVGSRGRVSARLWRIACAQKRMCREGILLTSALSALQLCVLKLL